MSLIDDARAAHKAGLSYGQYMTIKKTSKKKPEPEPKRFCKGCGGTLTGKQKTFCCNECRTYNRNKIKMEAQSETRN